MLINLYYNHLANQLVVVQFSLRGCTLVPNYNDFLFLFYFKGANVNALS